MSVVIQYHELIDIFRNDVINFSNFYAKDDMDEKRELKYRFQDDLNLHLKNELKWWLQCKWESENVTGSTMHGYCKTFICHFSKFMVSKYPKCKSCIEIPFDVLKEEYYKYLEDNNYPIRKKSGEKAHFNKHNQYVTYELLHVNAYAFEMYYKYVYNFYFPDLKPEYEKDIWDIRKLGIPYKTNASRPRYTLNFENISQDWLKEPIKKLVYKRIPNKDMVTICGNVTTYSVFSKFLYDKCPNINSLDEINRQTIIEFTGYLKTKYKNPTTYNKRLNTIETFFYLGFSYNLKDFPSKKLFYDKDYMREEKCDPVPFTDEELIQINKNLDFLPTQTRNAVFVAERLGLRIKDLLCAKIYNDGEYCIKQGNDNEYIFVFCQGKNKKTTVLPIDLVLKGVIESSIEYSRMKFGENVVFIFSKNKEQPLNQDTMNRQINKMCIERNIIAKNGSILRIKGHTFRKTVATEYANMGLDLNMIRVLLGQSSIGVLKHYVKIHSEEMSKYLKPIIENNYNLIESIGKEVNNEEKSKYEGNYIPLSCGYCSKDVKTGICEHANACYKCKMFVPIKEKLPLYKKQLKDTEMGILVCKLNGYEILLENNLQLKENLENIIRQLEENDYEQN